MVDCGICKNSYCVYAGVARRIAACSGYTAHPKPQTNADHIRSMTDEELAEFLMGDICGTVSPKDFDCYGACIAWATIWLKQPYKEEA